MLVLVCGGSKYKAKATLFQKLDEIHETTPISLIINGGAKGADFFSSQWANNHNIPLQVFKANWKELGQQAVFTLNHDMLNDGKPDMVLAFPGGDVTHHMVELAKDCGVKVEIIL